MKKVQEDRVPEDQSETTGPGGQTEEIKTPEKEDASKKNGPVDGVMTGPPELTIVGAQMSVQASGSTYSWHYDNKDGTQTGIEADGMHPLDMKEYMEPLIQTGEDAAVKLDFGFEPSGVTVRCWSDEHWGDMSAPEEHSELDGKTLTLKPGGYIYQVVASFRGNAFGGNAYYAFYAEYTPAGEDGAEFEAQYIRTNGYHDGAEYPRTVLIESREALEKYYEDNKELYDLAHKEKVYSDTTVGFADAMEKYTEEWFADHVLLMVLLEEGSGSVRHEVTQVTADSVTIKRIVPEVGTDDMAEWHVLIELGSDFESAGEMRVVFEK